MGIDSEINKTKYNNSIAKVFIPASDKLISSHASKGDNIINSISAIATVQINIFFNIPHLNKKKEG